MIRRLLRGGAAARPEDDDRMDIGLAGYLLIVLLGLVAGGAGGLLGIGGSLVMIPGLVLMFGASRAGGDVQHLYQAAAMIVNFFVVAPAVIRHGQAKATQSAVVRWTIPSAIVGAVGGVYVSEMSIFKGGGQGYLQIAFSVFLVYVVLYNLQKLRSGRRLNPMDEAAAKRLSRVLIVLLVGLPAGLLGGLLGIGGGLVAVPAQQVGLRIPLRNAIANSAATILWSSVVGAAVKNYHLSDHGHAVGQSLQLAVCLIPSAMVGSWYTAARVHRWPVSIIRVVFDVVLAYCGRRMFLAGWSQVGG